MHPRRDRSVALLGTQHLGQRIGVCQYSCRFSRGGGNASYVSIGAAQAVPLDWSSGSPAVQGLPPSLFLSITCLLVRYIGWSGHCALLFTSLAICGGLDTAASSLSILWSLALHMRCPLDLWSECPALQGLRRPWVPTFHSADWRMWGVLCGPNGTELGAYTLILVPFIDTVY